MGELALGWPQWIAIVWYGVVFLMALALDGKKREGTYNGALIIVLQAIWLAILYAGGFFTK